MKKHGHIIGLTAFLSITSCSAPSGKNEGNRQQSGTSSFSYSVGNADCGLSVETVNTRFSLGRFYPRRGDLRHVLVKERFEQAGCTNSESLAGTVSVDGWIDRFEADQSPLWHVEAEGDEAEITNVFYKVTKRGCCGATPSSVYFNLISGKKVFESREDLVRIEVPNTDITRYVAFLDTWSVLKPPEHEDDPTVIGALEYGPAEGPPERIVLRLKTTNPFSLSEIGVTSPANPLKSSKELQLWSANGQNDPSAANGFTIKLVLYEMSNEGREFQVAIPVVSDRLDIEHAEASPGVELRRSPQ